MVLLCCFFLRTPYPPPRPFSRSRQPTGTDLSQNSAYTKTLDAEMFGGDLDALVLRQLEDRSFTWEESVDWSLPSMRMHAMTMALKAADVGHPVKPLAIHLKWSAFVLEEFKLQNNIEEREGITPHFQISEEPVATIRSQIGFFKCVCVWWVGVCVKWFVCLLSL